MRCSVDVTTSKEMIEEKSPVVIKLYRFTFLGEDGNLWNCEVEESNLPQAFQRLADTSELIKIERINQITGEPVDRNLRQVGKLFRLQSRVPIIQSNS